VADGGEFMRVRGGMLYCGRVGIMDFFAIRFCYFVTTLCDVTVTDVIIFR